MKKVIASMIAVAGLAAMANAQNLTALRYEASLDGVNWSSSVNAAPGALVQVRARVQYIGTAQVGGLAQIIFQPVTNNWTGGDSVVTNGVTNTAAGLMADGIGMYGGTRTTPPLVGDGLGVYGRFSPWGASANSSTSYYKAFVGSGANAGLMRISQAHITNWIGAGATSGSNTINNVSGRGGINAGQIAGSLRFPTDPAFNTNTDVVVFKFAIVLSSATDSRTLDVTTPQGAIGRQLTGGLPAAYDVTWYTDTLSTAVARSGADVFDAHINVVNIPAPASLALLGLGGLAVARRRR